LGEMLVGEVGGIEAPGAVGAHGKAGRRRAIDGVAQDRAVIDVAVVQSDAAGNERILIAVADIVVGFGRVVDAVDGDGEGGGVSFAMLVGHRVADDDVGRGALGEMLVGEVGGIEAPGAVGAHGKAGRRRAIDGVAQDRAVIDVAVVQSDAAGNERILIAVADIVVGFGRVVYAVDGDGEGGGVSFAMLVGHRVADDDVGRGALGEMLVGEVGGIEAPGAVGAHGKAGRRRAIDGVPQDRAVIDVAVVQSDAAGNERILIAVADIVVGFGRVVDAVDGDGEGGDVSFAMLVGHRVADDDVGRGALGEMLVGEVGGIEAPGAVGAHGKAGRRRAIDGVAQDRAVIDVAVVQSDAAGNERILIAVADIVVGFGRVVDAVDGDGEGGGVSFAMLVGHRVADDDVGRGALGEMLVGEVGGIEAPGAVGAHGKAGRRRAIDGVAQDRAVIDVAVVQSDAAGNERILIAVADIVVGFGRVVYAVDGDGEGGGVSFAMLVGHRVADDDVGRGALGEMLVGEVGGIEAPGAVGAHGKAGRRRAIDGVPQDRAVIDVAVVQSDAAGNERILIAVADIVVGFGRVVDAVDGDGEGGDVSFAMLVGHRVADDDVGRGALGEMLVGEVGGIEAPGAVGAHGKAGRRRAIDGVAQDRAVIDVAVVQSDAAGNERILIAVADIVVGFGRVVDAVDGDGEGGGVSFAMLVGHRVADDDVGRGALGEMLVGEVGGIEAPGAVGAHGKAGRRRAIDGVAQDRAVIDVAVVQSDAAGNERILIAVADIVVGFGRVVDAVDGDGEGGGVSFAMLVGHRVADDDVGRGALGEMLVGEVGGIEAPGAVGAHGKAGRRRAIDGVAQDRAVIDVAVVQSDAAGNERILIAVADIVVGFGRVVDAVDGDGEGGDVSFAMLVGHRVADDDVGRGALGEMLVGEVGGIEAPGAVGAHGKAGRRRAIDGVAQDRAVIDVAVVQSDAAGNERILIAVADIVVGFGRVVDAVDGDGEGGGVSFAMLVGHRVADDDVGRGALGEMLVGEVGGIEAPGAVGAHGKAGRRRAIDGVPQDRAVIDVAVVQSDAAGNERILIAVADIVVGFGRVVDAVDGDGEGGDVSFAMLVGHRVADDDVGRGALGEMLVGEVGGIEAPGAVGAHGKAGRRRAIDGVAQDRAVIDVAVVQSDAAGNERILIAVADIVVGFGRVVDAVDGDGEGGGVSFAMLVGHRVADDDVGRGALGEMLVGEVGGIEAPGAVGAHGKAGRRRAIDGVAQDRAVIDVAVVQSDAAGNERILIAVADIVVGFGRVVDAVDGDGEGGGVSFAMLVGHRVADDDVGRGALGEMLVGEVGGIEAPGAVGAHGKAGRRRAIDGVAQDRAVIDVAVVQSDAAGNERILIAVADIVVGFGRVVDAVDGDGEGGDVSFAMLVGHRVADDDVGRGALGEMLVGEVGGIEAPGAVGAHGKAGRRRAIDGVAQDRAVIDVAVVQSDAAGNERILIAVADIVVGFGRVVDAVDGDGEGGGVSFAMLVGHRVADDDVGRGALGEMLVGEVGGIEAPGAVGAHGKAGRRRAIDGVPQDRAVIDVAVVQSDAAGNERILIAVADIVVGFGRVVDAVDGDGEGGDVSFAMLVGHRVADDDVGRGALGEMLVGEVGGIEAPGAVGAHGKAGRRRAIDGVAQDRAVIDVAVVQSDAAGNERILIAVADIVVGFGRVVDAVDGDGEGGGVSFAMLVGHRVADDDVGRGALGEMLVGEVGGIEAPGAVGAHGKAGRRRAIDGVAQDRAVIDVAVVQSDAAGNERILIAVADIVVGFGRVVDAVDGDGEGGGVSFAMLVGHRVADDDVGRGALGEMLVGEVGGIEAPGAVGAHGKAGRRRAIDGVAQDRAVIDVAVVQSDAAGNERILIAVADIVVGFGRVVRTLDRYVDRIAGGAVQRGDNQSLGLGLAQGQGLGCRAAVIERVGPGTGVGIEGEAAVCAVQCGRCWSLKLVLAGIGVVDRQRAAGAGIASSAVGYAASFNHAFVTGTDHGDRCLVIGAGDVDLDGGFAERAVAETDGID